jgi:4-amino-4-deoxy-L-arabinose transferase-like glycosyltransferase
MSSRPSWRLLLSACFVGLAVRLCFVATVPVINDDDTLFYAEIAQTWLNHGVYGQMIEGIPMPTYVRLPGYPAFLAVVFTLFGPNHYGPVLLIQALVDVGTCFLIAALALAMIGEGAALGALWVSVLCPFTANYAAVALTETVSVFLTSLALWSAVQGLLSLAGPTQWGATWWLLCGLGIGGATLFRPDGILLLMALWGFLGWQLVRSRGKSKILLAGMVTAGVVATMLAPWTIRNWVVFHEFEPLAPRYSNDPGEYVAVGFNQWFKTWPVEFASLYDIFWKVGSEDVRSVDLTEIPPQAADSPRERQQLLALFTTFNKRHALTPDLDAQFAELARQRIARHPVHYYVSLPALRIADMWFRPRTEQLRLEHHWWRFHPLRESLFSVGYALLNALLVMTAVVGMGKFRHAPGAGLVIGFVVLRSAFLGTLENPEPRYVLECFPVILTFAGAQAYALWQRYSSRP